MMPDDFEMSPNTKNDLTRAALMAGILFANASLADPAPTHVWCDPDTGLCWQNPQRAGHDMTDSGLISAEAGPYCDSLVLGGYSDWRVPTIDELRTLIAGNEPTQTDGDCPVQSGTGTYHGLNRSCHGGTPFAGPADGGCYWKAALQGRCDKPDVTAVKGKKLETWAGDRAQNAPERWTAYVSFDTASVGFNHNCSSADVRCVRDNDGTTPACARDDTCEDADDYVSDPELTAHCDADVCGTSDAVEVTLRVPESLTAKPYQLMVFWYKASDWTMPPGRPPDGGTDYNQVMAPDIDFDKPLTMNVPGCTYYREELLSGAMRLFAHLQMSEGYYSGPRPGDYGWASDEPVTFPLDGDAHDGHIDKLDITLNRVE